MPVTLGTTAVARGSTTNWDDPLKQDLIQLRDAVAAIEQSVADGSGGTTLTPPGCVNVMDSMFTTAGTSFSNRLRTAYQHVLSRTDYYPFIYVPPGDYTHDQTLVYDDALRILGGVGAPIGFPNLEKGGHKFVPARIKLTTGRGASSAFVGTTTTFGMWMVNIGFYGTGKNQMLHHPIANGTLYCASWVNCSWDGVTMFGEGSEVTTRVPAAMTLCTIRGDSSVTNFQATPMCWQGSDNLFFEGGSSNIGPAGTSPSTADARYGAGRYIMVNQSMGKTVIGPLYITADDGWLGVLVTGTPSYGPGLYGNGWRLEGRNSTDPCDGALLRVNSGAIGLTQCSINYGMASPSKPPDGPHLGVVDVRGGNVDLHQITYDRTSTVPETTPFLSVTGSGKASAASIQVGAKGGAWTGLPRVYASTAGRMHWDSFTTQLASGSATGGGW